MSELKRSASESSSVGEQLRYAREAKGFSQQEISRALCLSVNVIDALERDAHHELPGPIFVKGYLKNYANFLQLDWFNEPSVKINIHPKTAHPSFLLFGLVGQLFLKLLNYAVIIILSALIFIWWHDRQHLIEKDITLNNLSVQEIPFPRSLGPESSNVDNNDYFIRPWWPFKTGELTP